MAQKFFFVCGGILMLALAYHFGAGTATAQAPGNSVVGITSDSNSFRYMVVTATGDTYLTLDNGVTWARQASVFGGGPTPANTQTWGSVKVQAR